MTDLESQQRAAVVAEARTWLGTPYHHEGRVKGVGVDCLQLLAGVFSAPSVGLIEKPLIPHYPWDWHLHRDAERYMEGLTRYTREIEAPPHPGDIVLFRFGRCFSHGGIVVKWPTIIHAYVGKGCVLEDAQAAHWLTHVGETGAEQGKKRAHKFFSYWAARPAHGTSTHAKPQTHQKEKSHVHDEVD